MKLRGELSGSVEHCLLTGVFPGGGKVIKGQVREGGGPGRTP